ncbi:MAG: cytochrome c3 family protein [Polyangia bacterium]
MSKPTLIAIATVTALATTLVAGAVSPRGPSKALLPPARPSVREVHQLHEPGNPPCATCHPRAASSRWASDRLGPEMETCADCHPEAEGVTPLTEPSAACRECHLGLARKERPRPGLVLRPNVRFSHAAHGGRDCAECHPRAAAGEARGPVRDVAGMRSCYACHEDDRRASAECRTCHLVEADGKLVTRISGEVLTPPAWLAGSNHGPDWKGRHARAAGRDSSDCAACHRESFCRDCHGGGRRPRDVHPGDWLAGHGVGIRMDNPHCRSCHRSQSFCISCHRRSGVAPDSPAEKRPPGSGGYHRGIATEQVCRRARHDITSCVSCHSEGSCIRCHGTIRPHPPGWSRRCAPLARRNHRACAKCHDGEVWRRCR